VEFDLKWDDYLKESDAVPLNTIQNNLNRRPYNSESNIHALNSQQQTIQQNRRPSIQETAKIESLKNEWYGRRL
jgi:hypothetical protein